MPAVAGQTELGRGQQAAATEGLKAQDGDRVAKPVAGEPVPAGVQRESGRARGQRGRVPGGEREAALSSRPLVEGRAQIRASKDDPTAVASDRA